MKKENIKMFTAGDYGKKGKFGLDELKNMVKNTSEKIKAQYVHTSHWNKLNKEKGKSLKPITVGEFSNLRVENDNIYGDVEFNDTGDTFFDSGIIDKLSVELNESKDAFTAVAALPLGVKPAVTGAEFEFEIDLEFEDINNKILEMPLEEKLELFEQIAQSIDRRHRDTFRKIMYEFQEGGEETLTIKEMLEKATSEERKEVYEILGIEFEDKEEPKTVEEIKAETRKEVALEFEKEKFLEKARDKFTPAEMGIIEFAAEKAFTIDESENTYEFEEDGKKVEKTKVQEFEAIIENKEKVIVADQIEFETSGSTKEDVNAMAEAKMAPYIK